MAKVTKALVTTKSRVTSDHGILQNLDRGLWTGPWTGLWTELRMRKYA